MAASKVCVKVSLVVINVIFFTIGCTLTGVGSHLFFRNDLEHYTVIGATDFVFSIRTLFICCGAFILIVAAIGIGAALKKQRLIILYLVLLCLLILASITVVALALSYYGRVHDLAKEGATLNIRQFYGLGANGTKPHPVTVSVDYVQKHFVCCGWLGAGEPNIFQDTPWYRKQAGASVTGSPDEDPPSPLHKLYPESCCVTPGDSEKLEQCTKAADETYARTMGYMHAEDCVDQFIENNGNSFKVALGVTIVALVIEVVLLIFACLSLRQSDHTVSRVV